MNLFEKILAARGLTGTLKDEFLSPRYDGAADPFLLPDMTQSVERLVDALSRQQRVTIYGDYDIDGLTATTVLLEAFKSFGFKHVDTFMPNRFVEGYGLTVDAIEQIAARGTELIVTVDCGSLSLKEVERAGQLGLDVIVTDHHSLGDKLPPAVGVINPKRQDHGYPFVDFAGVGVAFKLVQALQYRLPDLAAGQEKWLLDLVALGTICDVVPLVGENRALVYYGLSVLKKTRRPGLRALMAVAGVEAADLTSRSVAFGLGPRMNAAGRLETAQIALDLLTTEDKARATELAARLDEMNRQRRQEQDKIMNEAKHILSQQVDSPVLVVSAPGWNHGVVGIVAAKLLETYRKPAFVLGENGAESKGSARSFGDFSAVEAIRATEHLLVKGGGHKLAAGLTIETKKIDAFRSEINRYYTSLGLGPQEGHLLPEADVEIADFEAVDQALVEQISKLEPFGNSNPEPIIKAVGLVASRVRQMGDRGQHVKIDAKDAAGRQLALLAFSAPEHFFVEPGERFHAWFSPIINDWRGVKSVEGRLVRLETVD